MIGPCLGSGGNDLYGRADRGADKSSLIPRWSKAGETEPLFSAVEIASESHVLTSFRWSSFKLSLATRRPSPGFRCVISGAVLTSLHVMNLTCMRRVSFCFRAFYQPFTFRIKKENTKRGSRSKADLLVTRAWAAWQTSQTRRPRSCEITRTWLPCCWRTCCSY